MAGIPLHDRSAFRLVSGLWKGDREPLKSANVVRSTNFRGDGVLDFSDVVQLPVEGRLFEERALKPGDIVIERSGGGPKQPVGRVAYFSPPDETTYFTSNFTTALRVLDRTRFDPAFVALYLHALYLDGQTETLQRATTGIRNLDWQEYLSFEVPELPLQNQSAFVALIDGVRSAYRRELELFQATGELKKSLMAELFASGLKGEAQKQTAIGLMPSSWQPRPLPELCSIQSGGTPRKSNADYWKGDIPWVSGKDLKLPALDDAEDHVTAEAIQAGSRLVPKGTVLLLVRGMGLAKDLPVAVINREMAFNQDIKALVPKGEFSGAFIRSAIYAGKERLLSQIVPSAHGTMTLNLNDVENFQIACPADPDEATEIAEILGSLDAKIDLHRKKRRVLEELFKALLQKLMTGEIDVNDLDLSALQPAT